THPFVEHLNGSPVHRCQHSSPAPEAPMALLGYARTSTSAQDTARQVDALEKAGCERVWQDAGVSGARASRPQLDAMLDYAREGDVIVVWDLSRLGRSIRQLVVLADDLRQRGIHLRSLTQGIDTSAPHGGLLLGLFAALAEMEREVLVQRTLDGLAAARARGRVGGRPPVLVGERLQAAQAMLAGGATKADVAR